ncbi:MAG: insulinase family protein [Nanoarchaeota archaeon]|nr:insulinase family protein [Nanoarchaeota archaeon]MBU1051575.1 insulinase family protein [Nanoarchaeota archaeon]MBU1988666.1 insulinase family protein [Nanoarchaeota archaeon]
MKLQKKVLKNGTTVLFEKRDLPVVSASITNRFGGAYERSEIKGVAHVIEHLLFTGTKTRTHEDISREIEKKGGILNAFTAQDATSFWFKLPSEHLFAGLDILVDLLKNPKFDKDKFEKEKKVILEEIKMYHDNPRTHVGEMIEKNLYDKPFGELIIGNARTVSALDRDFVASLFKKVYSPENYIVTVVGDASFEKVCEYFEKNFEAEGKKTEIVPIKKLNGKSADERPGIDQAHLIFAFHAPLMTEKEYFDLEVLDAYLAKGMSSKLFLEIREKRGLAYTVKSSLNTEKNYSYYSIYVGTTKEAVPEVKKLILQGFGDASKKMTPVDLQEGKERLIGLKKVMSEESSDVMNEIMYHELISKAEYYYDYEKKIEMVKLGDVKKIALEGPKRYSTAEVLPK